MDFITQLILKAAVGSYLLIVSGSVLYAVKQDRSSLRYALIIFGASLWVSLNAINEYLVYIERPQGWLASLGGLTSLAVCFSIFDYALHYPEPDPRLLRLRPIGLFIALAGAPFVFFPDWIIDRRVSADGELIAKFGWPYAVSSAVCVALAAAAVPVFLRRLQNIQDRRHRRQIKNFLGGSAVVLVLGAVFVFLLPVFGITRYYFVGVLSVWFFAYYSLMSVYKSGVIDFRRELRETLRFVVLYAGVFLPVTVLLWWLFGLYTGQRSTSILVFGLAANAIALQLAALFQRRTGWSLLSPGEEVPEIAALKHRLTAKPLTLQGFRSLTRKALDLDYLTIALRESDGSTRTIPRGDAGRLALDTLWTGENQDAIHLSGDDLASEHQDLRAAGYDVVLPLVLPGATKGKVLAGTVEGLRAMSLREISNLQYLLEVFGSHRRLERLERQWKRRERDAGRAKTPHVPARSAPDANDAAALAEHLFSSPAMQPVLSAARKYASIKSDSILITGETGAGKGVSARYLHALSEHREREMITLDCATIPADLVESELFGHVKGAFTGATRDHQGVFERAQNTNLFLDEIGELSLELQVKLLRVLQDRTFYRVGGDRAQTTNARFFFATNRDLPRRVESGAFRSDLFYRINVMSLSLPPLRERAEEIPALAEYYLREFLEREELGALNFSLAAMDRLRAYPWPGNLRELNHAVHRAAVNASGTGTMIAPEHLDLPEAKVQDTIELSEFIAGSENALLATGYKDFVAGIEREILERAFQKFDSNQSTMAKRLQLERNFLRRKLIEFGIIKNPAGKSGRGK